MTKLTKKQTRKLTSRKTKKLLKGGGPLGRLRKFFSKTNKNKQGKTVPQESSSTPSTYSVKTNPIPGQPLPPPGRNRRYSPAKAAAMSNAHYKATAALRGFTNSFGKVKLVSNPLYITSESANGSASGSANGYSSLAPRRHAASTPSLGTTPGYSVLPPQGEPVYVPVSNLSRNQTLYAPTESSQGQELKSALRVIAEKQQVSPADEAGNPATSLYSSVSPRDIRSASVTSAVPAPALPPRQGSNTSKNIRKGKPVVFLQEQQNNTENHRRGEENNIGSNRRIKKSLALKNATQRNSHLQSYIKNLEQLGNSSFINKKLNTQTENSIMEKYLFNKNPEYINAYKLLTPTQQDIIRRRFLTYSPSEISRMAKDDDLYSIFYSEIINKF
jgi:hypothetical protein